MTTDQQRDEFGKWAEEFWNKNYSPFYDFDHDPEAEANKKSSVLFYWEQAWTAALNRPGDDLPVTEEALKQLGWTVDLHWMAYIFGQFRLEAYDDTQWNVYWKGSYVRDVQSMGQLRRLVEAVGG